MKFLLSLLFILSITRVYSSELSSGDAFDLGYTFAKNQKLSSCLKNMEEAGFKVQKITKSFEQKVMTYKFSGLIGGGNSYYDEKDFYVSAFYDDKDTLIYYKCSATVNE